MISLEWVKDYIDISDQDLKELAELIGMSDRILMMKDGIQCWSAGMQISFCGRRRSVVQQTMS